MVHDDRIRFFIGIKSKITVNNPLRFIRSGFFCLRRNMSVYLKRIAIILAIVMLGVGVRIYGNGLCSHLRKGVYTVYGASDQITVCDSPPLLGELIFYERFDLKGSEADARLLLKKLNAVIVEEESVGEITIIYAYANSIAKSEKLFGEKVNIMIALSKGNMTVGSPLIKGSY